MNSDKDVVGYAVCGVKSTWGFNTAGRAQGQFSTYDNVEIWPLSVPQSDLKISLRQYINSKAESPLGYFGFAAFTFASAFFAGYMKIKYPSHLAPDLFKWMVLGFIVFSILFIVVGISMIPARIAAMKNLWSPDFDLPDVRCKCLEGRARHILSGGKVPSNQPHSYPRPRPADKEIVTPPGNLTGEIIPGYHKVDIVGAMLSLSEEGVLKSTVPSEWRDLVIKKLESNNFSIYLNQ